MINALSAFFRMGGYGFYVWTAYGIVFVLLGVQFIFPWQRWQRYLRKQKKPIHE